jgi:hypothetical protein
MSSNQASHQSVQARILNVNAMDDMFIAFSMVQKIMRGLSGAVTEKEKFSVVTEGAFSVLKSYGADGA